MIIKGKEMGKGIPCICAPVMETEKNAVIEEIKSLSESPADMIEWRVDAFREHLNQGAIREVLEAAAPFLKEKIFLYTFRTKKQGGNASVSLQQLNDIHETAAKSGCVDLIDLEYFELEKPLWNIRKLHGMGIKVVASHHDFEETPKRDVMKMLLERMCAGGADFVKIAAMPNSPEDVLSLLSVTSEFCHENPDTPVITMSMGKQGVVSRLCGESFGSAVTFASHKKASAPGQMDLYEVAEILKMIHNSIA